MLKAVMRTLMVMCVTFALPGVCAAQASGDHPNLSEIVVAPWSGQMQVTISTSAGPNEVSISPTRLATGKYFIPENISSAWAELEKMLPSRILRSVEQDFAKERASCRAPVTPADWSLREWLRINWLGVENSPLRHYFQVLGLDLRSKADDEDVIGFILCGFFHHTARRDYDHFDAYHDLISAVLQRKSPLPPRHPRCPGQAILSPAEAPRFVPMVPHRTSNPSFSVVSLWVARCVNDSAYFFYDFWDGWFYDDHLSAELMEFLRQE